MSLLLATPDNPVPEEAEDGFIPCGEILLRYMRLPASAQPLKGTVICLHGRNECIEKYFETANDLAARGFDVVTFDWRGQGGSTRFYRDPARGYVEHFDQYAEDFEAIFEGVALPDCRAPFYVLAHSTGALAALNAAPRMANRIRRMVLIAPLLELANLPISTPTVAFLARLFDALGFGTMYMAGGPRPRETRPFDTNVLTTDPVRYRRNAGIFEAKPELGLGGPTVAWVKAACAAIDRVCDPAWSSAPPFPFLWGAAGGDRVAPPPGRGA